MQNRKFQSCDRKNGNINENDYFYRDKEKREIDLIIDQNGKLYPIEIKKKSNPDKNDIRHFHIIEDTIKKEIGEGCVICLAEDYLPIAQNVYSIPVGMI